MRLLFILLALAMPLSAQAFSYATGGCATAGCAAGEQWEYTNANEIDTALDALETTTASHTSTLSGLSSTYLALAGGTMTGDITMGSGTAINLNNSFVIIGNGGGVEPSGTGYVLATGMSATGQIDDNDLAAGAVDLNTGEVEGTLPTTKGGTGATALTNLITLATHTTGNYVATIADSGASEITVANSGAESAAVTLAIASSIARDSEVTAAIDLKSAASSTSGNIPKFSGPDGDLVDTGVAIDGSNNVTIPGNITAGTSGYTCFFLRDKDDAGDTECTALNGTLSCRSDAGTIGTCDGP